MAAELTLESGVKITERKYLKPKDYITFSICSMARCRSGWSS